MSLSQSSLLDLIPSLIHNSLSLYLCHLAVIINHLIHGQQDSLVFWSCKSVVVKISSTEITPIRRPSRRTSFLLRIQSRWERHIYDRVFGSGWEAKFGNVNFTAVHAETETCAASARIYHSERKSSMSRSSHIPSAGTHVTTHSHKRKSSRDTWNAQEKNLTSDRIRSDL